MINRLVCISVILICVYFGINVGVRAEFGAFGSNVDAISNTGGMDTLGAARRHSALAFLLLALQHTAAMPPYGGIQQFRSYAREPIAYLPFFRPQQLINPFQRQMYPMPFIRPFGPRPMSFIRRPIQSSMPQLMSPWTYQVNSPKLPPKVVYRQAKPKPKRISVLSGGPLVNVVPYPHKKMNQGMGFKSRKAQRRKMVAKAKSFSGILKNTALGTNML